MDDKKDSGYRLAALLRKTRRRYQLSASSQALFYELVAIANEEGWPDTFKCSNGELCSALNSISEKTLTVIRNELIQGGLIRYKSGKSKRTVGEYSFSTGVNFTTNANTNPTTVPTTIANTKGTTIHSDLIKQKGERQTKTFKNDEDKSARELEIDQAVGDYCASLSTDHEKEKKVAPKKEKDFPAWDEMIEQVAETAHWRNVAEHHRVTGPIRDQLFKIFYEQKEDDYRIRLPGILDMAKNFYFWVGTYKRANKKTENANTKHNASGIKQRTEDKREALRNLQKGSSEFIRRTGS